MALKRWPVCISDNGGKPRVRIKHKGRKVFDQTIDANINTKSGIAAAVNLRDEIKHRLALGLSIIDETQDCRYTFSEAAQDYIHQLTCALSTQMDYVGIVNNWWMPVLHNQLLDEITTRQIRQVLAKKLVSTKRKRNALIPLRGIFDLLDIRPNPAEFKLKNTDQKQDINRYLPEERNKLLSLFEGENLVYFALLFGCGFRPSGEVLALTWDDYDGATISVNKTISRRKLKSTTKTYMARRVVVPDWIKPILDNHTTRFAGGHIFLNSLGTFYRDSDKFNAAWLKAHELGSIPYRIPYVCRHTRAAELLSTGVEPMEAAKQLGHSLEMFNRTYSELIDEYCKERDPKRFNGQAPEPTKVPSKSLKSEVFKIK